MMHQSGKVFVPGLGGSDGTIEADSRSASVRLFCSTQLGSG